MPPMCRAAIPTSAGRLWRACVGRLCRYRLGRAVLGSRAAGATSVEMLGPSTLCLWEEYLRAPRGSLRPSHGTYTALAISGGRVVGHVSVFKQWERPDVQVPGWWLTGLEVAPRCRGRAIGRRLVQRVIDSWRAEVRAEDLYLVVHRGNRPAIALFESFGFRRHDDTDWEQRLAKVYRRAGRPTWEYQIMKRPAVE